MKFAALPLIVILAFTASARGDSQVEPPVPVRTAAPEFPYEMSKARISGFVLVNCLVDEHGNVQDMQVEKSSNQQFVPPAMAALKKWKFKPAERDGNRVAMRVTIPIRFTFED